MEENSTTPSPPAPKIPQSPLGLGYDLVKAAFVVIFGVVITMILEQLAKYIMAWLNQPAAAEPAAPTTVPPPLPPQEDPQENDLELGPVADKDTMFDPAT